jgi:hypothetical protein
MMHHHILDEVIPQTKHPVKFSRLNLATMFASLGTKSE